VSLCSNVSSAYKVKSEIRIWKSETNANTQTQKSKFEMNWFGIFLLFDHLNLFRISDFEFRIYR